VISTFTAVLDANVLFGIRLTSLLMELAMSGLFRARWSLDIHREWMEAVHKKHGIPRDHLEIRRQQMEIAIPDGRVEGYEPLITAITLPDPNDRHVLAAAIRCNADVIVTFNEADFPASNLEPFGIHTRHPDLFIRNVDEIDPGTLIEAARNDMVHYRNPPLNVDTYIAGLREAGVPATADYLTQMKVLFTAE
jgi:predicted nucleic acid-binding protein